MSGSRANVCLWHTADIPEHSTMSSFERKRTSGSQALKIAVMHNDVGSLGSLAAKLASSPKAMSDLEQSFSRVPCGLYSVPSLALHPGDSDGRAR